MGKSIIVEDLQHCFVCGRPHPQIHHVIYGTANRSKSDQFGLILPLCMEHHTGQTGVHRVHDMDLHFKQLAQKIFEEKIGDRQYFISQFGRSYMED